MANGGSKESRASGSTIVMEEVVVRKRQAPARSRAERTRTEAAQQLAAETGLFGVPRILEYDDRVGEIVFERVPGERMRLHLVDHPDPNLMVRAGRILGAIHGRTGGKATGGDVSWHGDYGLSNVLYDADADRLWILDWSNAPWTGLSSVASTGSPVVDVTSSLISLFHRRAGGPFQIPTPEGLATAFLTGYDETARHVDYTRWEGEQPRLLRRWNGWWRRHHGLLSTVAHLPSLRRMERCVRRLRTHRS